MVSTASMAAMVFSLLVSFLFPIGLAIYFYRKDKIYLPAILIGAAAFAVTQLVLRIPLLQWLGTQDWYIQYSQNTLLLTLFLSLTAGLFEETGRFISFRYILKNRLEWKNGMAYGIGHGGFEAIALVGVANINNLVFSTMINSGNMQSLASALPSDVLTVVTDQLIKTPAALFMVGGIERIMVIVIHIALSLVVLYGVMNRRYIYWLYAVLLHTLVNAPVVLLQKYGILVQESLILIMFIIAVVFIARSRKCFTHVTS